MVFAGSSFISIFTLPVLTSLLLAKIITRTSNRTTPVKETTPKIKSICIRPH